MELEFELELELLLELELELLFELEFELLLELEFELELLLWFELEFELWLELEFELWLELVLLLWFEPPLRCAAATRFSRLIVFRFCTARARHHSIGLPSIIRSRGSAARPAGRWRDAAGASVIGATLASPSFD